MDWSIARMSVRNASMVGEQRFEGSLNGFRHANRGSYAPIAWISGRMPMIFMTRVRL